MTVDIRAGLWDRPVKHGRETMVVTYEKFDFGSLQIETDTKQNKAGGKFASIGYGDAKQQVKFQLGGAKDALKCEFGIDKDSKFGKTTLKLEVAEPQKHFVEKLETCVLDTALKSNWFKKASSKDVLKERMYCNVKKSDDGDCIRLKIEESGPKKTSVMVAEWRDAKLTKPIDGTLEDVVAGAMVLPIVRIQGGVWFSPDGKSFGISLGADSLLVIKGAEGAASSRKRKFELDVELTDDDE